MKASLYTGIPFLFVSLILGMQWAIVALDVWSFFDMKIIGSFILACYLWFCIIFEAEWQANRK